MPDFIPRALATGIGSLPHKDTRDALRLVFQNFPTIPFWPQLPRRDFREDFYTQVMQDMVCVKVDMPHEWIGAILDDTKMAQAEEFYARYLTEDINLFAMKSENASGLYALRDAGDQLRGAQWLKGQMAGPISMGLKVVDQTLKPLLYDDTLRDVLVKHIARKAQWQEQFLQSVGAKHPERTMSDPALVEGESNRKSKDAPLPTIVFIDEPSLSLIGASVVALNRDEVVRDLEEVFSALHGLKGTHCCGNTDWSMLLETSVNAISFDAYTYAENLALFANDVKRFLDRGGVLAWGIVPTVEEHIACETEESLVARLDAAIALLVKKGIDRDLLYERALITAACGVGTISERAAERALALTRGVSQIVRAREWKIE